MNKISLFLLLVASIFGLSSCGGSGTTTPSPFQGNFSGSWISTGPDVGTASISVLANGTFSGSELDTTISLHGTVTGHLSNNGTFTGTVVPDGGASVHASGVFSISQDGMTISGNLTFGGVTYTYTLSRI